MARGFRFEYPGATTDSDYDGLFDWHELLLGLNPYSPDSDSDGLPDAWELAHGFDPHNPADGLADPDHDGLTNGQEYALGTKFEDADSDGDGMPDGWEAYYYLNPNLNDAYADSDNDGLSNYAEFVAGTHPGMWDTDGDGRSDAWELANGGDPTRAGSWPTLSVPLGRIFHHFTLFRRGAALSFQPHLMPSGLAEGTLELFDGEPLAAWDGNSLQWSYLLDDATGETLRLDQAGWYAPDQQPWQPAPPALAPLQHFLLPYSRAGHSFVLVAGDACYPVTVSQPDYGAYSAVEWPTEFGPVALASASCPSNSLYPLLDLSTGEISPGYAAGTDLRNVYWAPHGVASFTEIVIRVPDSDFGREFMVASGDSFVWRTAGWSISGAEMVISAPVPFGKPFAVNRAADGARVELYAGIELSAYFNLSGVLPTLLPAFHTVTIDATANHTGIVAYTALGEVPATQGVQGTITSWDDYGVAVTNVFYTYSAVVPVELDYHFRDDQGNLDDALKDHLGLVPPPSGWVNLHLPPERGAHQFELRQFDPADPEAKTIWLLSPGRSSWNRTVSRPVDANTTDQNQAGTYEAPFVLAAGVYDRTKSLEVWDVDAGEGQLFPALPPGVTGRTLIDLTDWVAPQTVTVYISATRWDHNFKLHTDHGDFDLPLVKGEMQGHYSESNGTAIGGGTFTTYWYFDASVSLPSNRGTWWVYDATTNERAPVPDNRHNLSQWLDANADRDEDNNGTGNGLPDWYDHLLSTGATGGTGLGSAGTLSNGGEPGTGTGSGGTGTAGTGGTGTGGSGTGSTGRGGTGTGGTVDESAFQWPNEPLLKRPRAPVTGYAVIPVRKLAPNERVSHVMLGEGMHVAFQLWTTLSIPATWTTPPSSKLEISAWHWSPGGAPPLYEIGAIPAILETDDGNKLHEIVSITASGAVTAYYKRKLSVVDPCNPIDEYSEVGLWTRGSAGPPALSTRVRSIHLPSEEHSNPYPAEPGGLNYYNKYGALAADNLGNFWCKFERGGQYISRNHYTIADPGCPPYADHVPAAIAAGSFKTLGYGEPALNPPPPPPPADTITLSIQPFDRTAIDSHSVGGLELAMEEFVPPPTPPEPILFDGNVANRYSSPLDIELLKFNNTGSCLAGYGDDTYLSLGPSFSKVLPALPRTEVVQLGEESMILAPHSLLARDTDGSYKRIALPLKREGLSADPIYWLDFHNASLTAVGTQPLATGQWESVIMKNGTAYPLSLLCPGRPKIYLGTSAQYGRIINSKGAIVAVVDDAVKGPMVALLLPVEMRSQQARNDGQYDISKHDPAIYPRPGNVRPLDAERCLENALTLFFEDCADPDQIIPRNSTQFSLKAGTGLPQQLPGITWETVEKPPGAPNLTPGGGNLIQLVSSDQGVLKGGLYRYKLNGSTAEGQVWLPLAGPDISTYRQSEITYFKTKWGPAYQAKLDSRTILLFGTPSRVALKKSLALKDMLKIGGTLDWHGDPKGAYSPCGGPNSRGDEFRLTIHGVVTDLRKRNNMMFGLIGREMGIPETSLILGADPKYDPFATGAPDTPATKEAYRAGFDLFSGVTLPTVMKNRGRKMQEPNFWSRREWPSWEAATTNLTRAQAAQLQQLIE
jgi:hypothetical protein